jgi:hypothetical protein
LLVILMKILFIRVYKEIEFFSKAKN